MTPETDKYGLPKPQNKKEIIHDIACKIYDFIDVLDIMVGEGSEAESIKASAVKRIAACMREAFAPVFDCLS